MDAIVAFKPAVGKNKDLPKFDNPNPRVFVMSGFD